MPEGEVLWCLLILAALQVMVGAVPCQPLEVDKQSILCLLAPLGQQGLHEVSILIGGQAALAGSRVYVAAAFQVAAIQPRILNPTGTNRSSPCRQLTRTYEAAGWGSATCCHAAVHSPAASEASCSPCQSCRLDAGRSINACPVQCACLAATLAWPQILKVTQSRLNPRRHRPKVHTTAGGQILEVSGIGFPTHPRVWNITLPGLPGLSCLVANVTFDSLSCLLELSPSSAASLEPANGSVLVSRCS